MCDFSSKKLTDYLRKMKKLPICSICKNRHHFTDDPYQYLDCLRYYRKRDTELGLRKEPMVEIWDIEKKGWVISKS